MVGQNVLPHIPYRSNRLLHSYVTVVSTGTVLRKMHEVVWVYCTISIVLILGKNCLVQRRCVVSQHDIRIPSTSGYTTSTPEI